MYGQGQEGCGDLPRGNLWGHVEKEHGVACSYSDGDEEGENTKKDKGEDPRAEERRTASRGREGLKRRNLSRPTATVPGNQREGTRADKVCGSERPRMAGIRRESTDRAARGGAAREARMPTLCGEEKGRSSAPTSDRGHASRR